MKQFSVGEKFRRPCDSRREIKNERKNLNQRETSLRKDLSVEPSLLDEGICSVLVLEEVIIICQLGFHFQFNLFLFQSFILKNSS